jgi:hypothetical protein
MMDTKLCLRCKRELPISQFQKDRNQKDGFYSLCKDCKREYRQSNKDKLLVAQYERRVGNADLAPMRKAWNALYCALKKGKIIKPEYCSVCQKWVGTDKIQAHHRDYSQLFEITWCCQDCHVELDKARREAEYAVCSNT